MKEPVRDIHNFDYGRFLKMGVARRKAGNPRTRNKIKYKNIVSAFDIETTRIKEIEQTVMYIWQWCFFYGPGDYEVVVGRTWEEFLFFSCRLSKMLKDGERLIMFVHNLSYEFQFLRGIYNFTYEDVFSIKSRKVLKCVMYGNLEFRCSYIQTNMSLAAFTDKYKVSHRKLVGELDYNKNHFYYTKLTDQELSYAINDVIGLCEAIYVEMQSDGDTLATIPLTSTGYVRRDARAAMRKVPKCVVSDILPDYELYKVLREAFRGGNTHANRYYAGVVLDKDLIHSVDRSSSYPAVQCCNLYPVTRFFKVREEDVSYENIIRLIADRHRAVLCRMAFFNIRLSDRFFGCPYIPESKCRNLCNAEIDNGRVLSADYLEISITDIDLNIIQSEYSFDEARPDTIYHARYGRLPQELINCTIKYYKTKTELKSVVGQEIYYMKNKIKLNSIYGMMAQNPVRALVLFNYENSDDFTEDTRKTEKELLADYEKHAFLPYQWGVWVTAWARFRLEEGIRIVGRGFIYCDTDSIKYVGNADFSAYNRERIQECKEVGAFAKDSKGKMHYMGVFEKEADMIAFKTLGAKKYAYIDTDGKLHCTIAGVSKKAGALELERYGGISAFKEGFVFNKAGGLEAVYNDKPEITTYKTEDGHVLRITSNVTLRPSMYKLGITGDYERILKKAQILLTE